MNSIIRLWQRDDLESVRTLLLETWKESYSRFIPVNDLMTYFNEHMTVEKLTEQLQDPKLKGYIAEVEGQVAGFEKTYYHEDEGEHRFFVQQLYIRSLYQNRGLGRLLMKTAAEQARARGVDKIWLGVMVNNTKAIDWYHKLGYEVTEQAPFTMGQTTVDHLIGFVPIGKLLTDAV